MSIMDGFELGDCDMDCFELGNCGMEGDFNLSDCDMEGDSFLKFFEELISSDPSKDALDLPPRELMPHEDLSPQHEDAINYFLTAEFANQIENNEDSNSQQATRAAIDEDDLGWTEADNQLFAEVLKKVLRERGEVNLETGSSEIWTIITKEFNKCSVQMRSKTQLYSHFRYAMGVKRVPCYLAAEEQLILAFDEVGIPVSCTEPFLVYRRSEALLLAKLQKLKVSKKCQLPKAVAFRRRIQGIIMKSGGPAAFRDGTVSRVAVNKILYLIKTNPHLKKKYLAVKKAGRPEKQTKYVPVTHQLKTLFKPFVYVTKRRPRTTSLPGDGRRYGMNMFSLNRLLGSPLVISKMPCDIDDAVNNGIAESDVAIYNVLRELILTHSTNEQEAATLGHSLTLPSELTRLPRSQPVSDSNSGVSDSSLSLLPPTLFTITGLRGLLHYRDTLKALSEDSGKEKTKAPLGNQESDAKLKRFLMSAFNMPWKLSMAEETYGTNSDGDSDSDEEVCYCNPELLEKYRREHKSSCSQVPTARQTGTLVEAETECASDDLTPETVSSVEETEEFSSEYTSSDVVTPVMASLLHDGGDLENWCNGLSETNFFMCEPQTEPKVKFDFVLNPLNDVNFDDVIHDIITGSSLDISKVLQ